MSMYTLQCSFELSEYTANVDGVGTLRLLDAVRTCELDKTVKFYQVLCGQLTFCCLFSRVKTLMKFSPTKH